MLGDVLLAINAFRMKKRLDEIEVEYLIYRVTKPNIVSSERHRILNNLGRKLSDRYRCIAIRYTPTEDFNGVIVFGRSNLNDEIAINDFKLEQVEQGVGLNIPHSRVRSFFYGILRAKLEYHGFWPSTRNKYYRFQDEPLDKMFRIFRGAFFRFEILEDGSVMLILDPLTRIVSYDTVHELASRWGDAKARGILRGRYIIALVARRGELSRSLLKVHEFRPDLKAGVDKLIDINGKKYTIKEYYSEHLKLPKVADLIPDEAPVIKALSPNSSSVLHVAASMAHLNYRTDDIPPDYLKKIEQYVFLKPDQRVALTMSFLDAINPLTHPYNTHIGTYEFEEELFKPGEERSGGLEPPRLKFKRGTRQVDIYNYTRFFRESIRELGVAREISIPVNSRIAVVYPENYITDNEAKRFYSDIIIASKRVFKVSLPEDPFLWGYRDDPSRVMRNYKRFKSAVLAAVVILRSEDDEFYAFFKNLFREKVSQMATARLVLLRKQLPREKLHRYRNAIINLVSGLLGKLGLRPWLLEEVLKAKMYIGIDLLPGRVFVLTLMDGNGNYVDEKWMTLRGSKINSDDMRNSLYQLVIRNITNMKSNDEFSIVFMRDGDVYPEEVEGMRSFIKSMMDRYSKVKYSVLSVKKNIPYRLYRIDDDKILYPDIGSYAILGEKYAILASSGYPILRNRLAKPLLIELVEAIPAGWYNIHDALKDSYKLSFMHWATLTQKTKYPAPIKYADDFSYLISKGIEIAGPPL